jgi:hypothetical protein
MMRFKTVLFLLVLGAAAVPAARAQNGIYVMYSGAGLNGITNAPKIYGPTVGAYLESRHVQVLSAGVDFRASFSNGVNNASLDGGLVGFRLVVRPRGLPIAPYGELLIGMAASTVGSKTDTNFQSSEVLGLDYTIVPHLDWRVAEFSYGHVSAANAFNPASISTGIVLRLP